MNATFMCRLALQREPGQTEILVPQLSIKHLNFKDFICPSCSFASHCWNIEGGRNGNLKAMIPVFSMFASQSVFFSIQKLKDEPKHKNILNNLKGFTWCCFHSLHFQLEKCFQFHWRFFPFSQKYGIQPYLRWYCEDRLVAMTTAKMSNELFLR